MKTKSSQRNKTIIAQRVEIIRNGYCTIYYCCCDNPECETITAAIKDIEPKNIKRSEFVMEYR